MQFVYYLKKSDLHNNVFSANLQFSDNYKQTIYLLHATRYCSIVINSLQNTANKISIISLNCKSISHKKKLTTQHLKHHFFLLLEAVH